MRPAWNVAARWGVLAGAAFAAAASVGASEPLRLPSPAVSGPASLEATLQQRRSLRSFSTRPLDVREVSQLLWAAQGVTSAEGGRTAPSAGAIHPLTLWLVAGRVEGIPAGLHRYEPSGHTLQAVQPGDLRTPLASAALDQRWIESAPAVVVITADVPRTAQRYGPRADRYVAFEAGAAAQNLALQAAALGLGSTVVGAFDEAALRRALALPRGQTPLAIVPVGRSR